MPIEQRLSIRGADLSLWEWPGEPPAILFCHGTGLHSRTWDQVIAHLPGRHCYTLDFRGHGHSSKTLPYFWRTFGEDASAVAEALRLSGAIAVGHSMGGYSVTIAAAEHPSAFSALLLLDPVIRPKEQYTGPWKAAQFVSKRRNRWASPQEMFESFQNRQPFVSWDRQVLRDYCEYGLLQVDGAFELACPPAVEAAIYENGGLPETEISAEVAAVKIPVQVVRARKAKDPSEVMLGSPTAVDLASRFARGSDLYLPDTSHFIPMESPGLVADLVIKLAANE